MGETLQDGTDQNGDKEVRNGQRHQEEVLGLSSQGPVPEDGSHDEEVAKEGEDDEDREEEQQPDAQTAARLLHSSKETIRVHTGKSTRSVHAEKRASTPGNE